MARTTKILVGMASAASLAMATPAVASPVSAAPAPAPATANQIAGSSLEKLTPQEVRDLESRFPAQAKRLKESVARASAARDAGTESAAPMTSEAGYYKIHNWNSNKCLAIGSGNTANGANAIQWDCLADSASQVWWLEGAHVINYNSGKYLAIGASSTANGAEAIQWDYTGSDSQRWYWNGDFIFNGNSGKYLAIGASSTANGAKAIQWDYTGSTGQAWYVTQ
ncbi:RICIN domain-containing protein [Streptomyces sp. NPDC046203]|uniref:RICIN domain-containing protein n=1 Tax=Streptomyces sp. NPDC046203 TaxID=3154602 RepID=UPI0033CCF798